MLPFASQLNQYIYPLTHLIRKFLNIQFQSIFNRIYASALDCFTTSTQSLSLVQVCFSPSRQFMSSYVSHLYFSLFFLLDLVSLLLVMKWVVGGLCFNSRILIKTMQFLSSPVPHLYFSQCLMLTCTDYLPPFCFLQCSPQISHSRYVLEI